MKECISALINILLEVIYKCLQFLCKKLSDWIEKIGKN